MIENVKFQIFLFLFFQTKNKRFVACLENSDGNIDTWENIHMICPNQCVCQHSPFMDLSVARWIQGLRREEIEPVKKVEDSLYSDMIFNEVAFTSKKIHPLKKKLNKMFYHLSISGIF